MSCLNTASFFTKSLRSGISLDRIYRIHANSVNVLRELLVIADRISVTVTMTNGRMLFLRENLISFSL